MLKNVRSHRPKSAYTVVIDHPIGDVASLSSVEIHENMRGHALTAHRFIAGLGYTVDELVIVKKNAEMSARALVRLTSDEEAAVLLQQIVDHTCADSTTRVLFGDHLRERLDNPLASAA